LGSTSLPAKYCALLGPWLSSIPDEKISREILVDRVEVVLTRSALPKLPVAQALWVPRLDLRTAAAAWIYAGGAHHTGFSYALTPEHLRDFAEIAGIDYLVIDENTQLEEFKKELRWNDLYYRLDKAL